MTKLKELIAEIESDFSQYKSVGLIDRASLYRWASLALKAFGQSICTLTEKVVEVNDGVGVLPQNFHSLYFALRCDFKGYNCTEEDRGVLQNCFMWKERVEKYTRFNPCEPCCEPQTEKVVTEKIYFNNAVADVYYHNFQPLRLTNTLKKDYCAAGCKNIGIKHSPYEINIIGTTLHTNFAEGSVYIQYYGIEEDEEGLPIIPETPRAFLETYLEYHLKKRLLERVMSNGDDNNIANLFRYYAEQEQKYFYPASNDAKLITFTNEAYRNVGKNQRRQMAQYEALCPLI